MLRIKVCLGFALFALLLLSGPMLPAAEPLLEKSDLFVAGEEGYAIYRIPGIVCTTKGTVLAYCEARRTGKSDWDTIDILLRRSTDGGKTWGERQKIADVPGPKTKNPVALAQKLANPDDVTYNNAVAFVDRQASAGGKSVVHFLFCLEYMRCFYIRSDDDGQTFTKPVEITAAFDKFRPEYDWKVLATGPAHGIQLKTGRLVVPVWLSTGTGGHAHRPSVTATIFSDDHGQTWQRGDIAVPNTDQWIFPNETVIVELADGRVMLNVRSESLAHRRLVTISPDGATGWSKPKFDDALLEPICMASIVRHSVKPASDKNRIVFANPHNLDRADGKAKDGRQPRSQEPDDQAQLRRGPNLAGQQSAGAGLQRLQRPGRAAGRHDLLPVRAGPRRRYPAAETDQLRLPDAGPVQRRVADRRQGCAKRMRTRQVGKPAPLRTSWPASGHTFAGLRQFPANAAHRPGRRSESRRAFSGPTERQW